MKKITSKSVSNFMNGISSNIDNTAVYLRSSGDVVMRLYNTEIAQLKNGNILFIQTAGFNTNTTLDRLNALPNVRVTRKGGVLMLNGEKWDGCWKLVI